MKRMSCRVQGKRLCTADEWERACRGLNGRRYVMETSMMPRFVTRQFKVLVR